MISLNDIEINKFQLNNLLSSREKVCFKYLLKHAVFCPTCNTYCNVNLSELKIYLDRFNDIKITSTCYTCNTIVSHVMEFGENESFFRKAVQFRNVMQVMAEES